MTISEPGITVENVVLESDTEDEGLEKAAIDKAITSLKEQGKVTCGEDVRIEGDNHDYQFIRYTQDGFAEVWEYTGKKKKKRVIVPTNRMYKKDTFDYYYGLATGEIESPF